MDETCGTYVDDACSEIHDRDDDKLIMIMMMILTIILMMILMMILIMILMMVGAGTCILSRLKDQGSRINAQGSRFKAQGPRSRIKDLVRP